MLTSISSIIGNKGQANYAAGNAFPDVGYIAEQGGALEARFDYSHSLNGAQLITGLACPLTVNNSTKLKEEAHFGFYFSNHSTGSGGMNDHNGEQDDPTAGAIKALHLLHESQANVAAINKAALG
ncbi:Acyl transferase/acyl hydrolase/lysophospholipase [Penicillium malachiteum]|nr:Acyl transferase/acyl hydrolase/lysophospholipase [Penicillium malachiteum]